MPRSTARHSISRLKPVARIGRGPAPARGGAPANGGPLARRDAKARATSAATGAVSVPPEISAREAGLRYVTDAMPGIRRKRHGRTFIYFDPAGRVIKDRDQLARIRSLAIPPAYEDVWICPDPRGHLQAVGRDARRRKQYRYHHRWREVRDETKFERLIGFAEVLPRLRARAEADLALPGLPREKVLATVVRLLEWTCIRVGNEEYARANQSFGLTTLKDRHVEVKGGKIVFEFRGKSGKVHACDVNDRRLARIVARIQAIPGQELFQYLDEDGARHPVHSEDVNSYIREATGGEFSAKDFRTWSGTMLAMGALRGMPPGATGRQVKSNLLTAIDQVAQQLNNTRAVCRKYYIHPAIVDAYREGTLTRDLEQTARRGAKDRAAAEAEASGPAGAPIGRFDLSPDEAALLAFLRARLRMAA